MMNRHLKDKHMSKLAPVNREEIVLAEKQLVLFRNQSCSWDKSLTDEDT